MKPAIIIRNLLNSLTSIGAAWQLRPILARIDANSLVVDCGANVGDITAKFAARGATVHAFEPDPMAFSILQKRFSDHDKITLHNQAVWTENTTLPLYFHQHRNADHVSLTVSSSLHADKSNVDATNLVEVEAIDLTEFIASLGQKISVLKIDIEGAEVEVLRKILATGAHEKFDLAIVETHGNKIPGQRSKIREIKAEMATRGITNIRLDWV